MRSPFVRRSLLDAERGRRRELVGELEDRIAELHHTVARARDDRENAIAGARAANERADKAFRDCGKLISDLRAVIWHVDRRTHPDDQRLYATLEVRSELLWHSFRFDGTFRQALSYMVDELIHRDHDLMRSVLDWPPARANAVNLSTIQVWGRKLE